MKPTYEELEKKCALLQSKLAAMNELMNVVGKASDIVNVGIAELQSQKTELEARTVNLSKRSVGEVMHMSGFSRDYAEGWCAGNDNAIHEIRAVFTDIRAEEHELCDGRRLVISPDLIADFRSLPFADSSFPVVVFDPPHLERVGQSAWMGKKYGRLNKKTWRTDLRAGFKEAFRVLWPHGVLIFKWNETQIPVSQILALTDVKPAIGQRTGKNDKTHWIIFVKD